jgi:Tol biopolymer transport system component
MVYERDGDLWQVFIPSGERKRLTFEGQPNQQPPANRNPVWSPFGEPVLIFGSNKDLTSTPGYKEGYELHRIRESTLNRFPLTSNPDAAYVSRLPLAWLTTGDLLMSQRDNKDPQSKLPYLALYDTVTDKIKALPVNDPNLTFITSSPEANQYAYATFKPTAKAGVNKSDIYVVPVAGGQPKAITNFPAELYVTISALTYSPDGKSIAFVRALGDGCGGYTIYVMNTNGTNQRKLYSGSGVPDTLNYSQSGKWLTYSTSLNCGGPPVVQLLNAEKAGKPIQLFQGNFPSYRL